MPYVIGYPWEAAHPALEDHGFRIEVRTVRAPGEVGIVLDQQPRAKELAWGSTITLTLSATADDTPRVNVSTHAVPSGTTSTSHPAITSPVTQHPTLPVRTPAAPVRPTPDESDRVPTPTPTMLAPAPSPVPIPASTHLTPQDPMPPTAR